MARFRREAEAAAKLDHPNLVRAIDADEAGGDALPRHGVRRRPRPRPGSSATAGRCPRPGPSTRSSRRPAGLGAAHARGIVHRDIKPSNLMLDASGTVKVLDLGLARLDDPDLSTAGGGRLTITNAFLGTADYMSPEQAFDPRLADARSDVYSLGCTLHYLLTAKPVYGGRSLMQRLLGHREGAIPSLRTARPDVPASLDEAFRRMVAKAPADRPAAMDEVVSLLEACRRDLGGSSRAAPACSRSSTARRGRPAPASDPASPTPSRHPRRRRPRSRGSRRRRGPSRSGSTRRARASGASTRPAASSRSTAPTPWASAAGSTSSGPRGRSRRGSPPSTAAAVPSSPPSPRPAAAELGRW